jgi:hypothetical protein
MAEQIRKKTGRPKIPIDEKVVEDMASVGATNTEIAAFVGCSEDTIRTRFAEKLSKARSEMKIKLRRVQMESALGGNVVMMIWLGKQMLDQKERTEKSAYDPFAEGQPMREMLDIASQPIPGRPSKPEVPKE